ncbi:hypothetical protein GCM10007940_46530 [Portibacter lacus]|uniref:Uncharacterized protein n=1 Tax=Portibacter lacus TaxID=1099794 RepID=A0AA37WGJ5_9BACT|nr:hypothetical protein [Portibacter lacus]GLR20037.1 hypothetical protein GCM10007940_46530 [Portibacter lacus]
MYSNSKNAEFGGRSIDYLPFSHFVDSISLKTLIKNIYYCVIAIDYSYNQSEASEILEVKRPDIIPPEASIFTDYNVSEEGISFKWLKKHKQ